MAQQVVPSASMLCNAGLTQLIHMQWPLFRAVQQAHRATTHRQPMPQQQQWRSQSNSSSAAATSYASSSSSSTGSSSNSRKVRTRAFAAHRARLPRVRKYGPELRDRDPAAFERMRLVVGYYDLPQNASKPRPPPPTHVTVNNLQALRYTKDVDPYYKLALLSYRSKLENTELVQSLARTRTFLQQLSAPPDFVPANLEALGSTAAAAGMQQQQQQEGSNTK